MVLSWRSLRKLSFVFVVLALAAVGAACGSGGGGGGAGTNVEMTDNAFTPSTLTATVNQKATFKLTNKGTAIHNLRIAGADNQYNTADDAVSKNAAISGGQSSTLEWTPTKAGTFDLRCDFHPTDMLGKITVQ